MSQRYLNTPPAMTEAQLQRMVLDLAGRLGFEHHHETNSFATRPGWPDLALWRPAGFQGKPGRSLFLAELKRESGKLTDAQQDRIATLRASGTTVFVWRPSDWDAIVEELER